MTRESRRSQKPKARDARAGSSFLPEPRVRAAAVPMVFFVPLAILAHFAGGGGAIEMAQVAIDRDELRSLVRSVRQDIAREDNPTIEILTDNAEQKAPEIKVKPNESAPDNAEADPNAAPDPSPDAKPPKPAKVAEEQKKKDDEKKLEKPKDPEPPKEAAKPKVDVPSMGGQPPPPVPVVPVAPDKRIAIQQHADKNQPDNPNANRIADDSNHVKEESVAKQRQRHRDDDKPSPGAQQKKNAPKDDVGNSDETKIADQKDKKGNDDHAPGENKKDSVDREHRAPKAPPAPVVAKAPPPSVPAVKAGGGKPGAPALPAAPPPSLGGAGPASPEMLNADKGGGFTVDPANPGGNGVGKTPGKKRPPAPYQSPVRVGSLGLGGAGFAPGGPNLNLTMAGVEQAVGLDKLKAERAADGAARKSAHRGSFETNKFEKWRAAIENYEPSVKLGNQTSLNAARVPFASYINAIHNRIHPIFAEEFLASLDNLPKNHAMNQDLVTHLEIVLSKDQGKIVRMGVVKPSGATAFDIVALNSVKRAEPFGKAPDVIVSPDGNVYLHWEFHRDPVDACTTRNARPFLLSAPPPQEPGKPLGPRRKPSSPSDERPQGPLTPFRR